MSKVIKSGEREASPYIFPAEKQCVETKREDRPDRPEAVYEKADEEYLARAVEESEKILNTARKEGLLLKEEYRKEGYDQGYELGRKEGYDQAVREHLETLARDREEAKDQLKACIEGVEKKKAEFLERYLDELKDIAVAIAEKVVRVSLRTSGETMKHMIASVAGGLEKKEWAKIYISKFDIDLMVEGNGEFLSTLADLSTNVKIIKMENEEQGTCILELPDEIVDLSVNTQMANIRELLDNA